MLLCLVSASAHADQRTIGKLGIDSKITLLDGTGIDIAQTKLDGRSGQAGIDNEGGAASNTIPVGVYWSLESGMDTTWQSGGRVTEHATQVAGVMIANDSNPLYEGVAPKARLHSIGFADHNEEATIMAMNRMATLPSADVRAINLSWNVSPQLVLEGVDGHSLTTQFVDWSARQHDVTYVVSWSNDDVMTPQQLPTDEYNGITVAATRMEQGYDRFSEFNLDVTHGMNGSDATGERTSIDLLAPGHSINILSLHDEPTITIPALPEFLAVGASYAAPHVTGTVALLQQWAKQRIDEGTDPAWNPDAQRHEVMKAVLLNSADKIAGVGASRKTICDTPSLVCNDWRDSEAYTNPALPLDDKMGAGHLNARGALIQFRHGEDDPGLVENVGWNYQIIGSGGELEYLLQSPLSAGEWVTATLAWDRVVNHAGGTTYHYGDPFSAYDDENDIMNNLDLKLVNAATGDAVDASMSSDMNLEHIFFQITAGGAYKIVVHHTGQGLGSDQKYALAWWAGMPIAPFDYNGDGETDDEDYNNWKGAFGVTDAADYVMWRNAIAAGSGNALPTAVPEPTACLLACFAFILLMAHWTHFYTRPGANSSPLSQASIDLKTTSGANRPNPLAYFAGFLIQIFSRLPPPIPLSAKNSC